MYNPDLDRKRLNKALDLPHISEAYHFACQDYLENMYGLDGGVRDWWIDQQLAKSFLLPEDINTTDSMWSEGMRPCKWHKYVAHSACHWLAQPYQLLAQELFPESQWEMVVTDDHTAVIDYENGIIFDLVFYAYGVEPSTIIEILN